METPRTPRPAQPEIQFSGGPNAPESHHVSDPAVNAAFLAFHRSSAHLSGAAPAKRHLNRSAIALAALTLLGFGGGLSLAFFSFNSTDNSGAAVASRAPEVIYTRPAAEDMPAQPDAVPIYDVSGEAGLFVSSPFELRAADEPISETSVWRDMSPRGGFQFSGGYADGGMPTFAAAGEQGFAGQPLGDAAAGDIASGFGALTAAPVPEPSTWASMISGAGLLLIFAKLKRRRS